MVESSHTHGERVATFRGGQELEAFCNSFPMTSRRSITQREEDTTTPTAAPAVSPPAAVGLQLPLNSTMWFEFQMHVSSWWPPPKFSPFLECGWLLAAINFCLSLLPLFGLSALRWLVWMMASGFLFPSWPMNDKGTHIHCTSCPPSSTQTLNIELFILFVLFVYFVVICLTNEDQEALETYLEGLVPIRS